MHEVKNKFIIINNELIMTRVVYHKDILLENETKEMVKGGGQFDYSLEEKTVTLYGESHDFGRASLQDIKQCIETNNIFTDKFRVNNNFENFKFFYKYQSYSEETISLN